MAGTFTGPCKDSATPVPCGDGTCRSDYVSCLRAMSVRERGREAAALLGWAAGEYAAAAGEHGVAGEVPADPAAAAASHTEGKAAGDVGATGGQAGSATRGGGGDGAIVARGRAAAMSLVGELEYNDRGAAPPRSPGLPPAAPAPV